MEGGRGKGREGGRLERWMKDTGGEGGKEGGCTIGSLVRVAYIMGFYKGDEGAADEGIYKRIQPAVCVLVYYFLYTPPTEC